MTQAAPRRGWRPPRMSLAALLALVAIVGGSVGWYAYSARVQRQAVRALLDAGATVIYDWEWDPGSASFQGNGKQLAGWRRILADRFGPDAVASVAAVSLQEVATDGDPGARDEHIALVGRLKSLRALRLGAFAVTEAGAAPIAGLERLQALVILDPRGKSRPGPILSRFGEDPLLERLTLVGAALDGDDLGAISRLSRLETLQLFEGGRKIGDADLAKLAGLGRLKNLHLSHTRITSRGLKSLGGMGSLESVMISDSLIDDLAPFLRLPMLKELDLTPCRVGDEALSVLGEMPGLKSFSLSSDSLTDAGLARLRSSPALEVLGLCSDSITADGLGPLGAIKTLKQIQVRGSRIIPERAAEFAKAHPGIAVAY